MFSVHNINAVSPGLPSNCGFLGTGPGAPAAHPSYELSPVLSSWGQLRKMIGKRSSSACQLRDPSTCPSLFLSGQLQGSPACPLPWHQAGQGAGRGGCFLAATSQVGSFTRTRGKHLVCWTHSPTASAAACFLVCLGFFRTETSPNQLPLSVYPVTIPSGCW